MAKPTIDELLGKTAVELRERTDRAPIEPTARHVHEIYYRRADDTYWRVTYKNELSDRRDDGGRGVEIMQVWVKPPAVEYTDVDPT